MALKTKTLVIENGRDKGKKFIIEEMPLLKADRWASRALIALSGAGLTVPDPKEGILGVASIALSAFKNIPEETALSLMNELLDCVSITPEGGAPRKLDLSFDSEYIEDISTLWKLRYEALLLHIDFLAVDPTQTLA